MRSQAHPVRQMQSPCSPSFPHGTARLLTCSAGQISCELATLLHTHAAAAHAPQAFTAAAAADSYDESWALYRRDLRKAVPKHPNVVVRFNTDSGTEGLRSGLIWAVNSWRQLKGFLRGPGSGIDAFARRCPYFECVPGRAVPVMHAKDKACLAGCPACSAIAT